MFTNPWSYLSFYIYKYEYAISTNVEVVSLKGINILNKML